MNQSATLDTAGIVTALTNKPVTPERALKVLKYLESPGQLTAVLDGLEEPDRSIVFETLTEQVVARHFAQRRR